MAGLLLLLLYLAAGLFIVRCLLPRQSPWVRAWLGLSLGLFLMMWLPALIAFLRPFDALTQWLSLLPLALIAFLAWRLRDATPLKAADAEDHKTLTLLLALALPLGLLGLYLQHTHVLRPEDGALFTGQATYGDLPLHLSIVTSLEGRTLPADYSILPGLRLGYPFLADSLSTSLLLPGAVMMALVFSGYVLLARRVCGTPGAAALAALFVFLNGGLGFLYAFDMLGVSLGQAGQNQLQQGQWLERLQNILQGWYQTPANHAEFTRYNLRFSNLVADMLLPQRTFLAGWAVLLPCLYLLLVKREKTTPYLLYGGVAALLALPQLLLFTFGQAGQGGFLRLQFNWVNNPGGGGLQDLYPWFYLKNIGLPFLLALFAMMEKDAFRRRLFLGAFAIFVVAELVLFQPNEYDNNKLFYVWWALCAMPAADYAVTLHGRLKGLRARPLIAGLAAVLMFASGALALAREALSDYRMFSAEDAAVARFARDGTPRDSRFVTATQHLNPISSLAGREIVCGPDLWLYYHGFDTQARQEDLRAFFADPEKNGGVPLRYGAGYILLGPYERALGGSAEALDALFELVYENPEYRVYRVPEG